jgi:hypothetical protein
MHYALLPGDAPRTSGLLPDIKHVTINGRNTPMWSVRHIIAASRRSSEELHSRLILPLALPYPPSTPCRRGFG